MKAATLVWSGPQKTGFDVLCVSESTPRAEDLEVIGLALREKRILLTEDKDFGRLVYSTAKKHWGDFPSIPNLCPQTDFEDVLNCEQQVKD